MSFSTLTNIITMVFCASVLVQSVRLLRCLRTVKGEAFGEMVGALDKATVQARAVLADLRETLQTDCAANARVIASGVAMREELTVMAGIADAVAERIVEAVEKTNPRATNSAAIDSTARALADAGAEAVAEAEVEAYPETEPAAEVTADPVQFHAANPATTAVATQVVHSSSKSRRRARARFRRRAAVA